MPDEQPIPKLELLRAKLSRAKIDLADRNAFLGFLLQGMATRVISMPGLETACIDGRGLCTFDPHFLGCLSLAETRTILLHETLHLALDAFGRRKGRDHRLWNMAHDCAVNALIDETIFDHEFDWLAWPEAFPPLRDLTSPAVCAEEIYDRLLAEVKPVPCSVLDLDGESSEGLSERWRQRLVAAAEHGLAQGQAWGDIPGWARQLLGPILSPRIPWQEQLRYHTLGHLPGTNRTFTRPSRRGLSQDLALPGRRHDRGVVGVFVDVSGSIRPEALMGFLAELSGILGEAGLPVRLVTWDACVKEDLLLEDPGSLQSALDTESLKLVGGGGTLLAPLIAHLEMAQALPLPAFGVLLTDGHVQWPEVRAWPLELLVVSTEAPPPEGYLHLALNLP